MGQRRSKATNREAVRKNDLVLPPGTPNWVSVELVEQTLEVWQPRYETPLSTEDAVSILVGASRLLRAIGGEEACQSTKSFHNKSNE